MKFFMFIYLNLFAYGALAHEIGLHHEDIEMKCQDGILSIRIPKIAKLTLSKAEIFALENKAQSICLALMKHLSQSEQLSAVIESSTTKLDTYIDQPTCVDEMCYVTYKYYTLEKIVLFLNSIPFNVKKEIPGSSRLQRVYWDGQDCPPFKPDCDL